MSSPVTESASTANTPKMARSGDATFWNTVIAAVVVGPRLLESARHHMHAIRLAKDCPRGRIVDDDELPHLLGQDQLAVPDGLQSQPGIVSEVGGRHGQLAARLGLEPLRERLRNRARFVAELGFRLQ